MLAAAPAHWPPAARRRTAARGGALLVAAAASRASRLRDILGGRGADAVVVSEGERWGPLAETRHTRRRPTPTPMHQAPCCHDGLTARLIERAGFPLAFMSGFAVAAARGFPDAGLVSYAEVADSLRACVEATTSLPIIADGDTGYGNCVAVARTVRGFAVAGAAGVLIEDQASPKSCGHVRGKAVVSRADAVARVRAAADARDAAASGSDRVVLFARSDARQAAGLAEALWRAAAYADAGADAVFVDALESEEELAALARAVPPSVWKMANNLEGGGKTPILAPRCLGDLGFDVVAYPLSLLGAGVAAQKAALDALRSGAVPAGLPSFADLQADVGFPEYWAQADRYASEGGEAAAPRAQRPPQRPPPAALLPRPRDDEDAPPPRPVVEPTVVVEPDAIVLAGGGSGGGDRGNASRSISRLDFLRIKVFNPSTNAVKLETKIPAGFVGGLAAIVPQAAGLDLDALARLLAGSAWTRDAPVWQGEAGAGDVVQIFVE